MALDDTIKNDDWRDVKIPVFGGLNKALDPDNLEMGDLVRGENICLIDDTILMANGFDPYHDTVDNDPWVGDAMKPFRYRLTDGTLGQILLTTSGLYRDSGSAWLQVAGGTFTGDKNNLFSVIAVPWADVIVFTNGLDPVQVYDPSSQTISNLQGPGGVAIYAKSVAVYDSSLFLFNTVESGTPRPQRLRYCDKGDITNWDTGVAGFRDLLDGTDPIMCGRLLGTYLIVYRTRGIHRVDISINDLERFQIDNMVPDNGVTSIESVVNIEKNRHLVWGRDNFYLYDGGFELEPIGSDVSDIVFEPYTADDGSGMFTGEDPQEVHKHHLMYFESINEIVAVYQSTGDGDLTSALLYRYGEKAWFTRKFPSRPVRGADLSSPYIHLSWDDLTGTWSDLVGSWLDLIGPVGTIYPIFASDLGGVETNTPTFKFDFVLTTQWVGAAVVATDIPTTFETKDFSEYPLSARMDWVDMRIDAPQEVTVEFSIDEGTTWNILRVFTTTGLTTVRLHRQIHYESIRFKITGFYWELKSMNLRVTPETEIGQTGSQPTFVGPFPAVLSIEEAL